MFDMTNSVVIGNLTQMLFPILYILDDVTDLISYFKHTHTHIHTGAN